MLKKVIGVCFCLSLVLLTGCSSDESKGNGKSINDMALSDIMEDVYKGFKEDELPGLATTEVTKENVVYYLGTDEVEYEEALASEPMIGSIAHSVVLVKMKEGADIEKAKETIKTKVDPRKWICVGVEDKDVIVDSKDNVIILILDSEIGKDIHKNFTKLG